MSMRNNAATVGLAVRSVQLQTLTDWEFIIIDDGSTDDGASVVRACGDSRIRLVREPSGAGLAARLNQAIGLSRGEFIARMDADDICFPDRLARQVARLREDTQIDLLGCGAVVFANDASLVGELPIGLTHEEIVASPFRGFPLPHPTWCGRADWFRSHPYDSKLMKTQDQDLLLRTFARSRFAAIPGVLIGYRQDALDLKKMLLGRRVFARSLWRHAQHSGQFAAGVRGIGGQVLKAGADIVTVGLGFNRLAQRGRLKPVAPAIRQQWQDLQLALSPGVG
jgi:glycosyltransferase involved in cell wall biosynthesis